MAMIPISVPNGTITFPMLSEGFSVTAQDSFLLFDKLTIHWYGVIIAAGFLMAYLYVNRRRDCLGLTEDEMLDGIIWGVIAGVIGARIYYVIFNFSIFRYNFLDAFKIWTGGLAIYGGVIGAVLAIFIYTRIKKLPMGPFLDLGAFGLLIGQAIGRWGNFINREVYGFETDIFCRMGLTAQSDIRGADGSVILSAGDTIFVHPTFLYESLWNILGFALLHLFTKKCKRSYDGQVFTMYVAWYGLGRLVIEGMRSDTLYLFNTGLKVSQVLAGLSMLAALAVLAVNGSRAHKPLLADLRKASVPAPAEGEDASTASQKESDSQQ